MIIRHYITCSTCEQPHTLRIQVGHQPYQEHAFQCVECEEEIVVGMNCDAENASVGVVEIRNCAQGSAEGAVVNLSPDFPIPSEERHLDLAFPSHHFMHQFATAQQELGITPPHFQSIEEARMWARQYKGINELWSIVKKGMVANQQRQTGTRSYVLRRL